MKQFLLQSSYCYFIFSCIPHSIQFSSVTQSCLTVYHLMDCSIPGFPVLHHLQSLLKLKSVKSELQSKHLILCCPLLLLPSVFPSIRVFSNELALQIKWPKYWSFSFKISPSSEYSALISFRIDWFDLLAVQGTLKSLLQYHKSKSLFFLTLVLVLEDNSLNRGHLVKVQFILKKADKNEIKVRVYLK